MDVRLTEASAAMLGVLEDIHLLSMTDYVVCTHSSNVRQYLYSIVPKRTIYVNEEKLVKSMGSFKDRFLQNGQLSFWEG